MKKLFKYKWPTEAYQYNPENLDALFIEWDWLKQYCYVNPTDKAIHIKLRSNFITVANINLYLNPGDWLVKMGVLEELTVFDDYRFNYLFEIQE